jgi:hypothetical protein
MLTILKRHLGAHASSFATSLVEPRYPLFIIYLGGIGRASMRESAKRAA